jgi:hypothetical protein
VDDLREKTLPNHDFVRLSGTLDPARERVRSPRVCRGGSRECFTGETEKQIQEDESKKAKIPEGSSRPAPSKASLEYSNIAAL